jgi:metacaspase-1
LLDRYIKEQTQKLYQGVLKFLFMDLRRKALSIGINKFRNFPQHALKGCVNDVTDMTALFKEILGFDASEITALTDEKATKANIMSALKHMVEESKSGNLNYLVLHISSHGTRILDPGHGNESDHANQAFVPHDVELEGDIWHKDHIITDDELSNLISQLPRENVMFEGFIDTCHSGSGIRGMDLLPDRKPRWLPPPSLSAFRKLEAVQIHRLHEGLLEEGMRNHILWTGCWDDQTSADAYINDSWNGAFTRYFCKVIKETNNKSTRIETINMVRNYLRENYSQVPQVECSASFKEQLFGHS